MEYVLGRIELPQRRSPIAEAEAWGRAFAVGVRETLRETGRLRSAPADARTPERLERIVAVLAAAFPEYVAFDSGPTGYRRIGPGHYRRR